MLHPDVLDPPAARLPCQIRQVPQSTTAASYLDHRGRSTLSSAPDDSVSRINGGLSMTAARPTLRNLARHIGNHPKGALSVRNLFPATGSLHLHTQAVPFTVLTQNMGLLASPAPYLGTDRDGAIAEIVDRVRAISPDVVGLCEVFVDSEREAIHSKLDRIYPHFRDGPDEADLESDGGLLLLSKAPIQTSHQTIFRDCDGWDCFANKGMIHIRVHPTTSPTSVDVFFTHAQDTATSDGVETLYQQLTAMNHFIEEHADSETPTLIIGDLNIPADDTRHYDQLLGRLRQPADIWTLSADGSIDGITYSKANNFYADVSDTPGKDQRLDYVLMRAGSRFVPLVDECSVEKFTNGGRHISDHFGVRANFGWMVEIR